MGFPEIFRRTAEAERRGLGAILLRKPAKLARLAAGIAAGSPLPVTIKIRTGVSSSTINCLKVCWPQLEYDHMFQFMFCDHIFIHQQSQWGQATISWVVMRLTHLEDLDYVRPGLGLLLHRTLTEAIDFHSISVRLIKQLGAKAIVQQCLRRMLRLSTCVPKP